MAWFEKLEGTEPARTKPRRHACGIEMCSLLPETEGMNHALGHSEVCSAIMLTGTEIDATRLISVVQPAVSDR